MGAAYPNTKELTMPHANTRAAALLASLLLAGCLSAPPQDVHDLETRRVVAAAALDAAEMVEHGRRLVYGPAHCVACHNPQGSEARFTPDNPPALIGGSAFQLPGATVYSPNITTDEETGIGRWSDAELVRFIRHGIRPDGSAALPIMEYQNLSDEDLAAIIAFLRSQEPVRHEVPRNRVALPVRPLLALMARPTNPTGTPRPRAPAGPSVARGEYLANDLAKCVACHTERTATGKLKPKRRFAGGLKLPSDTDPNVTYTTPNLTPHPEHGVMRGWGEEQFLARFRAGPLMPGSHMPWDSYRTMSDDDLVSIFRYLRSLEPLPGGVAGKGS
jgi:mono/diheme cytochrome c family protein